MKILNFGSCNIDFVYTLDHIVGAGETETIEKMNIFPGGKGLNQSIALARAGASVYHAGCVGEDGEMLLSLLRENGVDVSGIKRVDGKNGHAIIQVSREGENSIFIYPGSNAMITEELADSVLDGFEKGDYIILQNEISNIDYIVKKAFQKGMLIVLNPSPCNESIKKIDLGAVSYLVLNEIEAEILSGCSEPELSLKYFAERYPDMRVVLTLGKRGSVFSYKSTEIFQPSFRVETVDTTAAGDTFTGYFIAKLAAGSDVAESLRIAAAAAAIAVSRNGAAPSVPLISEVMAAIDGMRQNESGDKAERLRETTNLYILRNLKHASADGLAKELGYSVTHTQGIVKKIYGKPFSKVVQEKRCSAAAKLLKETDLSVSEIINSVGYENESFFRRLFKEKFGVNMLEYRNLSKK